MISTTNSGDSPVDEDVHNVVDCGAELTVRQAAELRVRLLTALQNPPVILDVGRIARVDAAGVQLLWCFMRTAARHDCGVRLAGTSGAIAAACETLGLELSQTTTD